MVAPHCAMFQLLGNPLSKALGCWASRMWKFSGIVTRLGLDGIR